MRYLEHEEDPARIIAGGGEDAETVRRVCRLVELSEFKRRQAPPSLRVSAKAFGVGRRFPIARFL